MAEAPESISAAFQPHRIQMMGERHGSGVIKKSTQKVTSNMEILPPEGSVATEINGCSRNSKARDDQSSRLNSFVERKKGHHCQATSLHGNDASCNSNQSASHSCQSSGRRAPPVQKGERSTRRTPTPTKQISLKAARRKENLDEVDDESCSSQEPLARSGKQLEELGEKFEGLGVEKSIAKTKVAWAEVDPPPCQSNVNNSQRVESPASLNHHTVSDNTVEDDSSSDEDSEEEEEEKIKAPNELLMEFITCLMDEDYTNAQKLCKMILIYEPDNVEALKFQPVIEEKLLQLAEMSDEETDSEEETSDEDSDSDSSEEDSSEDNADQEDNKKTEPVKSPD